MPRPEDDALSWQGDDDPTLDTGAEGDHASADAVGGEPVALGGAEDPAVPESVTAAPAGDEAVGASAARGTDSADPGDDAAPEGLAAPGEEPRRMGDAALVSIGVIGGVYLLWTVGWLFGVTRLHAAQTAVEPVADVMLLGSMVIAVLAPAIWFGAAWLLTRGRAVWVRIVALIAGIVVLVPWPFVMVGVIGQ